MAAAIAPDELTWNCAVLPTLNAEVVVVPPTATLPEASIMNGVESLSPV